MKNFARTVIFSMFCLISAYGNAAGWSGEARVVQLYAITPDLMLVKLENFSNPDKCQTNDAADVIFNAKVSQPWFAMLLSAYMAGKKVNIYVNGTCTPWWAGKLRGSRPRCATKAISIA